MLKHFSDFISCAICLSNESRNVSLGDRLQYFDEVKDASSLRRNVAHNVDNLIRFFSSKLVGIQEMARASV